MNYTQIAILFLQGILVAFTILSLFKFRKKLGIGALFACIGFFQFVQVFLSSSVYVTVTESLVISPGTSVFFTGSLFAFLIIYIKEGVKVTRRIIYSLFILNVLMAVLLETFGWNIKDVTTHNPYNLSNNIFDVNARILLVGAFSLILDSFLIIILFEFISKRIKFLFIQILITMVIVVSFDTILFSSLAFSSYDKFTSILISGLISKIFFVIFYSLIFSVYLRYLDSLEVTSKFFKIKDIFQPLSFRQKFNEAAKGIKKAEEMYRLLADNSNDLICLHENDSTFKYISPSVKTILGYKVEELIEKLGFSIIHKEDVNFFTNSIKKRVANKLKNESFVCRALHKNGSFIWLEFTASIIDIDKGNFILTSARDISKRIKAEQEIKTSFKLLEKSEYLKNEASKVAKIGFLEEDIESGNRIWSESMYNIFGFDIKNGPPTTEEIAALFDEKSQIKIVESILNLDTNGIPFDIELKMVNLYKEDVWFRALVQPVFDKENKIIGRRGLVQDITDTKKAQIEKELSKQEIQKALELLEKSEYSKNVASKMAKIGYWEHDLLSDVSTWSDYVHNIFGTDPINGIPKQEEIVKNFGKESEEKFKKATLNLIKMGISYDLELQYFNPIRGEVWFRNVAQPIFNDKKEIIGKRGLLQDITEFKKSRKALEDSKQEIRTAFDLLIKKESALHEISSIAKIGYWEYLIENDKIIWSDYLHEIFDLESTNEVPIREELLAFFEKESQKKIKKLDLKISKEEVSIDFELKLINKNNEEIWVRNVVEPLYDKDKKVIGRRGVMQDITGQKRSQQDIELSNQKLQKTLELLEKSETSKNNASKLAKIGFLEDDIKSETRVWSESLYNIFGFDKKKGIPSREEIGVLFDEESQKKIGQSTINLDTKGIPFDIDLKMTNLRNEEVWLRVLVHPIYNSENEIVGRNGVMQDITDSKKAQLELELSKHKIQNTLEIVTENEYSLKEAGRMAKIGYWKFENLNNKLFWSDAIYQIYGFDPKLGVPKIDAILKVYSEKSRKLVLESLKNLTNKGVSYDIELEFFNFKNEKRWIRNIGEPIFNDENIVIGRRGVSQDITQRKLSEKESEIKNEKLKELNKALNEAQKLSSVGSWKWNMVTDEAEWSDEMYNIYGVSKKDFYPSHENVQKYTLQEDLHKIEKGVNSLLVDNVFVPFEFRIKKSTGEIRHLHIVALEMNSKESVFGVTKDITERKKIEEENLIIQENYKRLFNNATVSIWNEDLSLVIEEIELIRKLNLPDITKYLEQNPQIVFKILSKLKVNKVNKATLELFKAKDYNYFLNNIESTFGNGADKVFGKLIEAIYNKNRSFTSEVNYKTLEGEEFAAKVSIPIPQTLTEQKTVPVSIQSIQSVKVAEQEKKKFIERLKESQEIANIGSWFFEISSKKTEWSEETYRIWGYDYQKPLPSWDVIQKKIHKDDQEHFNKTADLVFKYGTPYDIEYRICLPNNVQKTIRSICKPIFGENGEVVRLKGINQDITEKELIRNKAEKVEEMYRLLAENSNDLICLQEPNSTFKYISPSIKNLLGYNQSDFIGKEVFSIVHPDDIEQLKQTMYKRVFKDSSTKPYEIRIRHKKGHYVWFEFLSSPVYKDNEINYFVTSARDISLWMSAKEEIDEYQTSLQKLTTEMTLLEEKQKKEIASNIHDHLSQSLVISKMRINELKKNSDLKGIDEDLKFIEKHISEVLENSRKITYELSPPVLYQLGIIDALNWLFENVETTHKIKCNVLTNVNNIKLNDVESILVYRCIQELIKNVIKYADATLLTLNINSDKEGVNIIFTDNGNGFDTAILNNYKGQTKSGFGLFAVKERIKNIQGNFKIESKINVGTTINIFIPLSK